MGVLHRARHRKAVHDRQAAVGDLREATGRLGHAVSRLARATQDWSASQTALAVRAAGDSEAVARARQAGGAAVDTFSHSARSAQESAAATAHSLRKRGLRTFDVAAIVGVLALRKRLQSTRAAREAQQSSGA